MTNRYAKLFLALVALFASYASRLEAATPPTTTNFFSPQTYLGDGGNGYSVYYLSYFTYYTYAASAPNYVYKYNFGFLYFLGPYGGDVSSDEAYFYDFTESDYLYTSATLYPYFYSFKLDSFLYYFEDSNPRQFYEFKTSSFVNY